MEHFDLLSHILCLFLFTYQQLLRKEVTIGIGKTEMMNR